MRRPSMPPNRPDSVRALEKVSPLSRIEEAFRSLSSVTGCEIRSFVKLQAGFRGKSAPKSQGKALGQTTVIHGNRDLTEKRENGWPFFAAGCGLFP